LNAPSFISAFHSGVFAHLLEDVDVVRNLVRRRARRRETAAQHQAFDIDPLRLAGRNLAPGHTIRDLLGLLQLLVIENAKRAQRTVLPLGHSFDRIVDRGIDDPVDQRQRNFATALAANVGIAKPDGR
jgi:hypothetical protein